MCKSFLFAPGGGAIAYIASPVIQYQSSSEGFAKAFFSNLTRHANTSIGNAMLLAKSSEGSSMARYFHLLGDPAIQPLRSGPSLLSERLSNDIKISCSESFSGHFSLELLSPDTVRLLDDTTKTLVFKKAVHADSGTFTDEFVMNIPVELAQKDLTARVFCWNDSQESRLSFDIQSSASVTGRYNTSSPELINIKTVGSNLVFSLPQVPKASIVRIYSLQGRLIYRGKGIPGARFVSIPLRRIGLSAGYYIATLENDNMHAYSKFGYHPH